MTLLENRGRFYANSRNCLGRHGLQRARARCHASSLLTAILFLAGRSRLVLLLLPLVHGKSLPRKSLCFLVFAFFLFFTARLFLAVLSLCAGRGDDLASSGAGPGAAPLWRAGRASEPPELLRIHRISKEFAEPPPASGAGPGSLREELWISRV